MFNIGFAEIILILLIAFLVVGPKDLPKVARWLARTVKSIRRMIRELKEEVGWDELTQETGSIREEIQTSLKEADVRADLKEAGQQLRGEIGDEKKETLQAVKEAQGKKA